MLSTDVGSFRPPKEKYRDSKGFSRPPVVKPILTTHDGSKIPDYIRLRQQRDATSEYHLAQFVLETQGTYFPGMQAVREANAQPETPADINSRKAEVRAEYLEKLSTFYDAAATAYLQEAEDRYLSRDDGIHFAIIDDFYKRVRRPFHNSVEANDTFASLRYNSLYTILAMDRRRDELARELEIAKRRRFPQSVAEYKAIVDKDVQLRVARFLMADKQTQERMLQEFNWAWRHTDVLVHEYTSNPDFVRDIHALVAGVESSDPRMLRQHTR